MRTARDRRCSYIVHLDRTCGPAELTSLAGYLSSLSVAGCEVVILDSNSNPVFEDNARVLRWVGRHTGVRAIYRSAFGVVDIVRAAADLASCEKVIVADAGARWNADSIGEACELLDVHEAMVPEEYLGAERWWSSLDAARLLLRRGLNFEPAGATTFAFRRTVVRALRTFPPAVDDDHLRRLILGGVEVFPASGTFVQLQSTELEHWVGSRPRVASGSFNEPVQAAFFFAVVPTLLLVAFAAGPRVAAALLGIMAFGTITLSLRGRAGAAAYFPMRTVLLAPVWLLERSVSVYWALGAKLRGESFEAGATSAASVEVAKKAASGE